MFDTTLPGFGAKEIGSHQCPLGKRRKPEIRGEEISGLM